MINDQNKSQCSLKILHVTNMNVNTFRYTGIQKCLQNRPLAFVGDSRLRDVYNLLVHELGGDDDEENMKAVCLSKFVVT